MIKHVVNTPAGARGGIAAACLLTALGCATGLAPGVAGAQSQQVSEAVFKKYDPAREAYQNRDYATALRLGSEAHAVARTAFEKGACLKIIMGAALQVRAYPQAVEAIEELLVLDGTPAAEKLNYQRTLGQLYAQLNRPDKAISVTKEYIKATGGKPEDWETLATLYYRTNDCSNSLAALDHVLAGGRSATEDQLKLQGRCYFQFKDNTRRATVTEELLRRFPKKDYYTQLLVLYEERKLDDMAQLEMLRFGFDRDWLDAEADYVRLADLALDVGTTAEALRVLERGIARKAVKNADKNARLLGQARSRAAEDKKTLAQLDAEARAGKNGESDVKVGFRYFGIGEFEKAVEAINRGLQSDRVARVKRLDDANMVLGIASLKLKRKPEAEKAFKAAKADARMAAVASVWLNTT